MNNLTSNINKNIKLKKRKYSDKYLVLRCYCSDLTKNCKLCSLSKVSRITARAHCWLTCKKLTTMADLTYLGSVLLYCEFFTNQYTQSTLTITIYLNCVFFLPCMFFSLHCLSNPSKETFWLLILLMQIPNFTTLI